MILTHHIKSKMSQRGINKDMIALTSLYGKRRRDHVILNRQRIKLLLKKVDYFRSLQRTEKNTNRLLTKRLDTLRKYTLKIHDKGGITLVMVDGVCITSYNSDSRKYHKKGKKIKRK
ncbi:hypothetical protein KKC13_04720 [bacterium]|nr:hypothetical protein [bacterium]MBU1958530.1 hypothetical protein [bacterium]